MNASHTGSRASVFRSIQAEPPDTVPLLSLRNQTEAFQALLPDVQVSLSGYFYAVDFGPGVRPQHHRIDHYGSCSCYLGDLCPAVDVVRVYLVDGGEPVPEPPPGTYPVIPHKCPVCGSPVSFDSKLSSLQRKLASA